MTTPISSLKVPGFAAMALLLAALSIYPLDYRAAADCLTIDTSIHPIEVVSLSLAAVAGFAAIKVAALRRASVGVRAAVMLTALAILACKSWFLFVAVPGFCGEAM